MKKNLRYRQSVLYKYLSAYLVLFIVPLLISSIIYYKTTEVIKKQVIDNNLMLLEQARTVMDSRLIELDKMIQKIVMDTRVTRYLSVKEPFEGRNTYRTYDLKNGFYDYNIYNDYMYKYFIVFKKSNIAIGPHIAYKLPIFYSTFMNYSDTSYEEWYDSILNNYHNKDIYPVADIKFDNKRKSLITYIQSLGTNNKIQGSFIILLDNKKIQNLFKGLDISNNGWAYLMDDKGKIITFIGNDEARKAFNETKYNANNLNSEIVLNNQKMIITKTTSRYNGWKYVVAQPDYIVLDRVVDIKNIAIFFLAGAFIIGLALACYIAYRTTKPLFSIVDGLGQSVKDEENNIYNMIEHSITYLINDNQAMTKSLNDQRAYLKVVFLEKLLSGDIHTKKELSTMMKRLDLETNEGEAFFAIIVQINDYTNMTQQKAIEQNNMKRVVIKDILDKATVGKGYVHEIGNDKLVMILAGQANHFIGDADTLLANLKNNLLQQFKTDIVLSIGNSYSNLIDINRSYEEANQALYYNKLERNNAIVWYKDLPQNNHAYYFPEDLKMRLINLTKSGDKKEVSKILEGLLKENIHNRKLSVSMLGLFLNELGGVLIKVLDYVSLENEDNADKLGELSKYIHTTNDTDELCKYIIRKFQEVCANIDSSKKSHNKDIKNRFISIINENYSDSSLCLTKIAEDLKLSESYLSQFFRDQTGNNFTAYLCEIRMNKATELLKATDLAIKDIAVEVGFSSLNSFCRAFKKIYGLTPTKYRSLY